MHRRHQLHNKFENRRDTRRHHARELPASSHPEIEEEIQQSGGGLDAAQLRRDPPPKKPQPIISVDGKDVGDDVKSRWDDSEGKAA